MTSLHATSSSPTPFSAKTEWRWFAEMSWVSLASLGVRGFGSEATRWRVSSTHIHTQEKYLLSFLGVQVDLPPLMDLVVPEKSEIQDAILLLFSFYFVIMFNPSFGAPIPKHTFVSRQTTYRLTSLTILSLLSGFSISALPMWHTLVRIFLEYSIHFWHHIQSTSA